MFLSALGARISSREHASRVLLCTAVPSFLLLSRLIPRTCPALQWPRAATGPRSAALQGPARDASPEERSAAGVGACTTAVGFTGGELSASNKHRPSPWGFLWQMMVMKAQLCNQGSDLPNCFSAPVSGVDITGENRILKSPNSVRVGREMKIWLTEYFPYFNKAFESSSFVDAAPSIERSRHDFPRHFLILWEDQKKEW